MPKPKATPVTPKLLAYFAAETLTINNTDPDEIKATLLALALAFMEQAVTTEGTSE